MGLDSSSYGMDYYVSSSKGSDQNDGHFYEHPIKTLNKIKNLGLKAGDRLLLKRGDVWREDLIIVWSGAESGLLEISAYGEGPKPVLNGSVALTGWLPHGKGIYHTAYEGACQGGGQGFLSCPAVVRSCTLCLSPGAPLKGVLIWGS